MPTTTINPTLDCSLYEGAPTSPAGSTDTLVVGNVRALSVDKASRAAVRVDLTSLPTGIEVVAASLVLTRRMTATLPASSTFYAERITQPLWVPATATWQTYDGTNPWGTQGGDYTAVDGDQATITNASATLTFANLLALHVDAIAEREGLLELRLRGPEATGVDQFVNLHSYESATAASRPKYLVTYKRRGCVTISDELPCTVAISDELCA